MTYRTVRQLFRVVYTFVQRVAVSHSSDAGELQLQMLALAAVSAELGISREVALRPFWRGQTKQLLSFGTCMRNRV